MDKQFVIGIDEVGRGPVAGPVAVGVVAIERINHEMLQGLLEGMTDSKKLSEKKRDLFKAQLEELEKCGHVFQTVVFSSAQDIDMYGISKCIDTCTEGGLEKVMSQIAKKTGRSVSCDEVEVLLDGHLKAPERYLHQQSIIKGDEKEMTISAASVVAKVVRDEWMKKQAPKYPLYSLEKHKGYGTKAHMEVIEKEGMSPLHRRSFLKRFSK